MTTIDRTVRQKLCGIGLCGIGGHKLYRMRTSDRLLEKCVSCGYETPGITLPAQAYRRTCDGDPVRHRLSKV